MKKNIKSSHTKFMTKPHRSLPSISRSFRKSSFIALAAAAAFSLGHSAQAATQYWDTTTTANVQPGSGTWGTDGFWTADGTTLVAWTPGSVAVFAGDGAAASSSVNTNAGTDATAESVAITLGSAQSATNLFFNNTGFILQAASAQTLTLTTTSPMSIAAGKSASIGNNVTVETNFGLQTIAAHARHSGRVRY